MEKALKMFELTSLLNNLKAEYATTEDSHKRIVLSCRIQTLQNRIYRLSNEQ